MQLDRGKASGCECALKSDMSWVGGDGAAAFDNFGHAPYGCATGTVISRIQSPQVERIGRTESLSSSFCRWRASRPG